jgi:Leucine-rich repeat (LRR) protein
VLGGNELSRLEKGSLNTELRHLLLSKNRLTSLNGTVRNLDNLEWLMIHDNMLSTIENELPTVG